MSATSSVFSRNSYAGSSVGSPGTPSTYGSSVSSNAGFSPATHGLAGSAVGDLSPAADSVASSAYSRRSSDKSSEQLADTPYSTSGSVLSKDNLSALERNHDVDSWLASVESAGARSVDDRTSLAGALTDLSSASIHTMSGLNALSTKLGGSSKPSSWRTDGSRSTSIRENSRSRDGATSGKSSDKRRRRSGENKGGKEHGAGSKTSHGRTSVSGSLEVKGGTLSRIRGNNQQHRAQQRHRIKRNAKVPPSVILGTLGQTGASSATAASGLSTIDRQSRPETSVLSANLQDFLSKTAGTESSLVDLQRALSGLSSVTRGDLRSNLSGLTIATGGTGDDMSAALNEVLKKMNMQSTTQSPVMSGTARKPPVGKGTALGRTSASPTGGAIAPVQPKARYPASTTDRPTGGILPGTTRPVPQSRTGATSTTGTSPPPYSRGNYRLPNRNDTSSGNPHHPLTRTPVGALQPSRIKPQTRTISVKPSLLQPHPGTGPRLASQAVRPTGVQTRRITLPSVQLGRAPAPNGRGLGGVQRPPKAAPRLTPSHVAVGTGSRLGPRSLPITGGLGRKHGPLVGVAHRPTSYAQQTHPMLSNKQDRYNGRAALLNDRANARMDRGIGRAAEARPWRGQEYPGRNYNDGSYRGTTPGYRSHPGGRPYARERDPYSSGYHHDRYIRPRSNEDDYGSVQEPAGLVELKSAARRLGRAQLEKSGRAQKSRMRDETPSNANAIRVLEEAAEAAEWTSEEEPGQSRGPAYTSYGSRRDMGYPDNRRRGGSREYRHGGIGRRYGHEMMRGGDGQFPRQLGRGYTPSGARFGGGYGMNGMNHRNGVYSSASGF